MTTQRRLDLFFNVLLAYSRLRDDGERRQSEHEKEPRPDGTEEESRQRTATSLFFAPNRIFAIPHMIFDRNSKPNVLLGLEPGVSQ